jgi:hypothetical protein
MEAQNILEFDKFKESITYMQVLGTSLKAGATPVAANRGASDEHR